MTERVLIEGASTTVTQLVRVGVLDAELRLREPRLVRVTVRIEPQGERTISPVHVVTRNLAAGRRFVADPSTVAVTVRGSTAALARLDAAGVDAYVNAAGLARGRHTLPVLVDLGGRFTVTGVAPAVVSVVIR